MAGPPENIEPSDLWRLLQAQPRPHRTVDFPRVGPDGQPIGQVAIWVLTQEEQMACNAEAEKVARKLLKDGKRGDLGYEALFNNEGAVQVVFRACRDPKDHKRPAFPGATAIRESLTADEVGMLFEHYLTVQLELGPIVASLSSEELDAWVARIAEGGAFFFDLLSRETQKTLAISMASRLATSPTGSTSAGSLAEEAPSGSTPPDASESATAEPETIV